MNGHDTDPTPPHGIERPPTPKTDLREHYATTLGKVHAFTDHDRAVLLTATDALDALALAVWAYHHGDEYALRDALIESGRDWFGWSKCDACGEDAHRDDLTDHNGDELCEACHADTDDQDRDAYGAPYGGRDDLDEPRTISATITYDDDPEPVAVLFGVFPSGYSGTGEDLPGDWRVFFWLDEDEASRLAPGFGMGDGWTVLAIDDDPKTGAIHDALGRLVEIIEANADRLSAVLDD